MIYTSDRSVRDELADWVEGEGTDQSRHRHLVRFVIRMRLRDRNHAHEWIKKWNLLHPGSRLESDVVEQWIRGNRGEGWYDA